MARQKPAALRVTAPSARLAVIEGQQRMAAKPLDEHGAPAMVWFMLGVSAWPWASAQSGNVIGSAALLLAALVAVWVPSFLQAVCPVLAACCVYYGTAAAWQPWMLGLGAFLLVATSFLAPPRRLRLLGGLLAALPMAAVLSVLTRSQWRAEAEQFTGLMTGLGFGWAFWAASRKLARGNPLQRLCLAGLLVFLSAWGIVKHVTLASTQPLASMHAGTGLPALPPLSGVADADLLRHLERFRIAGGEDAAYAWVFGALSLNGDPDSVVQRCPRGGRSETLPFGWRDWAQKGALACAAMMEGPRGAAIERLAASGSPFLLRLRADLLMRATHKAPTSAYLQAAAAGDPFASRAAVAALLRFGQAEQAAAMGATLADPLVHSWIDPSYHPPAAWQAFNRGLDFSRLAAPGRIGLVPKSASARLWQVVDPLLDRWVLVSHAPPGQPKVFQMPLPPGAEVPAEVRLRLRSRGDATLVLRTVHGELLRYQCAGAPGPTQRPWPPAVCADTWTDVLVTPADLLSGALAEITLSGDFAVAYTAMRPRGLR